MNPTKMIEQFESVIVDLEIKLKEAHAFVDKFRKFVCAAKISSYCEDGDGC